VAAGVGAGSPLGRVVLITGAEALLADRAVDDLVARFRNESSGGDLAEIDAATLDAGRLAEATGPSLFSVQRAAVIGDIATLPADLVDPIARLAEDPDPDLALLLVHSGGPRPKALLDRLSKAKVEVVPCAPIKAWELPQFVTAEVRRVGGSIESSAPPLLVDAVGHELRSLAAAVAQLVADAGDGRVTAAQIRRYFAGRAEVTSFAVADAAIARKTGQAMEQLRWAMSTGVAPVLITSALASGLRGLAKFVTAPSGLSEPDLAREVGVPPWKLKTLRTQARGWDAPSLALALRTVATADADVKGAAGDADFALEQAVLAICRGGRS
jgi:DNA polymerase III subunit delta